MSTIQAHIDQSEKALNFFETATRFQNSLRNMLDSFSGKVSKTVVSFFTAITFWMVYAYLRRQFQRVSYADWDKTLENYLLLRTLLDAFERVDDKAKKFARLDVSKAVWYSRGFLGELKKLAALILKNKKILGAWMAAFDQDVPKGELFRHVPEKELWDSRIKAYPFLK